MALFLAGTPTWKWNPVQMKRGGFVGGNSFRVKAFFNPIDEPILKEALKEPIAFIGGMFAGLLRLDLDEDPLKEWITRTVEASGVTEGEIDQENSKPEEEGAPQQIEIE
eukprot:TRINITY_DN1596_c0_g1_i2.p1 TRINITY_DN1596_c0_g1~~TRINITY_DN1596_c0_g1_i2.p1  ORF type:complete len:109 (+),score=33.19 TRINITY_DN1596_c0_g1_i2:79-405(+)